MMFESCFLIVRNVISQCFTWGESIWAAFGISLIAIVTVVIVSSFVVRNYLRVFVK